MARMLKIIILSFLLTVPNASGYLNQGEKNASDEEDRDKSQNEPEREGTIHETESPNETTTATSDDELQETNSTAPSDASVKPKTGFLNLMYRSVLRVLSSRKVLVIFKNVATCIVNGIMQIVSLYIPAPFLPLVSTVASMVLPYEPVTQLKRRNPVDSYRRAITSAVDSFMGTFDRNAEDDPYLRRRFNRGEGYAERDPFNRDEGNRERVPFKRDERNPERVPFNRGEGNPERVPFNRDERNPERVPFYRDERNPERVPFNRYERNPERVSFNRDDRNAERVLFNRRSEGNAERVPLNRFEENAERVPSRYRSINRE